MEAEDPAVGLMPGRRAGRFRLRIDRSNDDPCAITAVAKDAHGIVLLASPDGESFRTVERLPMTAAEANEFYEQSRAPILTANDVHHLYGEDIVKLRLGRV